MQRYSVPAVRLSSCLAGVVLSLLLLVDASAWAQEVTGEDVPPPLPDGIFEQATGPYLSNLSATDEDALFTTYAAPLRRSEYIVDEGYQFKFYEAKKGLRFVSDYGGDYGVAFRRGNDGRYRPADFSGKPVVTLSYSDMVGFRYRPYEHVQVESFFQVYSSRQALQHLSITNTGSETISLRVMPYLQRSTPFSQVVSDADRRYVTFRHRQEPDGWTKRKSSVPHVTERQNVFRISEPAEAIAHYQQGVESALQKVFSVKEPEHTSQSDSARVVALHTALRLPPGATKQLRIVRGVAGANSDQPLRSTNQDLMAYDVSQAIRSNEALYRSVPRFDFEDDDRRLMYWSAFNLLRQNMLPPEGKTSYNYYVYSREPTWGWGHAGQVFHESLSMLAYVSLDAQSALNSQRVYMERQWQNGYVEYRAGPYLDATNFTRGSFTSSAPWYSYENWKLYQSTGNRTFLRDAYQSGKNFYTWWINNRDQDDDGLVEWGGHAVLESVRDANVALWHDVGWPSNFEAPELNSMLVKEARALAKMAKALGDSTGAKRWRREAQTRTEAIQETFWDSETGFFYYVDRDDHNFSYDEKNDLKRREITGFIPLWAGTATDAQAERLVEEHLTDSTEFWRPYGVPSLSASDSYYDPQGYWNGPVWVEWQFLLVRGLQNYGYHAEADELADRVFENVIHHLKTSHTFWEFYSPDAHWAGHHQTYIWTGLVARMLMDLRQARSVPESAP